MSDLTWYPDPDRPGRWLYSPIDGPPATNPAVTHIFNAVPAGDIADYIDPAADDPTPAEITDPAHPDFVQPWRPQ